MTAARCILLIDDDEVDRKAACKALAAAGWAGSIVQAGNAEQALQHAQGQAFDCVLLDYNLPGTNGLELLTALQGLPGVAPPVVMLTGEGSEMVAVQAMKLGAVDYLPKRLLAPDTLFRMVVQAMERHRLQRELAAAQALLEHQALFDGLTGLGNRRLFRRDLARTIAHAERRRTSFCLTVMDLDRFKAINDNFGHDAGDAVLAEVGRRFTATGRSGDTIYRLGGDEFTAIIDAPDRAAILPMARRYCDAVTTPITYQTHALTLGVSLGAAVYPADGTTADSLVRAADMAMYQAKRSGQSIAFSANTP